MPASQNVLIRLTVEGREIQGAVALPGGPAPLRVLLPALRNLTNAIVDVAAERSREEGQPISCRKGCDACCRQMVPISPAEAFDLAAHLDALPPAQAAPVLERFDQAVETLAARALLEPLRRATLSHEQMQALDRAYFEAQIPCPLLDDQACSIHPFRPLACREFLVSSDPVHCRRPDSPEIRRVDLGARLSQASMHARRPPHWLPLVLAREFVARHREPQIRDPATALRQILSRL